MFYNPYLLWNMYITMRTIHGVYVTFSFFYWLGGSVSGTLLWFFSFVYNPYEIKQIKDKKKLDEPD
jgi:hypothetical protein